MLRVRICHPLVFTGVSKLCTGRANWLRGLCVRATSGKQSSRYMTPQDIEKYFPTLKCFTHCGASVVICQFPYANDVPGLDLHCLERLDQYTPSLTGIHPNKILSFHGGRIALRRALAAVTTMIIPRIGRSPRGAPLLPSGVTGSISHKENFAVACALLIPSSENTGILPSTDSRKGGHVGVDIEYRGLSKAANYFDRFSGRVLTENEKRSLGGLKDISLSEEVMLRFSLKEAVYKSIEPKLKRHVAYKEIEVYPQEDGTARIVSKLLDSSTTFTSIAQWSTFSPGHVKDTSVAVDPEVKKDTHYWISCVHSYAFSSEK